ncbi:MAG: DMT family transporter, partial [Deferrisomatales bacterium]
MTRPSPPGPGRHPLALASALFVVVLWGASFAVTRAAVREIPPMTLALVRFVLAALVLWPVVRRRCGRVRVRPGDRWAAFGLGFLGVTLYFAFENVGLVHTTASHGALIVATIPLVSALAEAVARRRAPSAAVLAGSAVALAGVALTVGGEQGGQASLLGDGLMFGAVLSWVGYTFLAHRLGTRYPNLWVTQAAMVVGAITLAPLAAAELAAAPALPAPSPEAWAAAGFLGLFCSALGYLLWNA